MPIQAAELKAIITADSSQAESSISGFGSKLAGLGTAISGGTALIGTALAGVGIAGVKMAADLQQSVANISTIKPDIDTSAVFNSLSEISTRVPQSAQSLADGLYNIFSSINVSQDQALQLVEQFAKGAVGAQTDAQTFGTAVIGVMNAYGSSVDDASHISDVFFNTVNSGVVNGQELAANLGLVTQSAKGAGVGFDELGALIVGVTKEGGPAAQNINNLSNLLLKIHTPAATKGFKDLGIATTDASGNFRSTIDVMGDLQTHLATMTEAQRNAYIQKIFPDIQAQTGARVIMGELDNVRAALAQNTSAAGSAEAAYQKMSQTASAQFQLLKNTGVRVLTQLGAAILPVITPLLVAFNQQLPGAIKAFQAATEGAGGGAGLTKLQTIAFALGKAFQFVRDSVLTFAQALQGNWTDAPGIVGFQAALGNLGLFIRNVVVPAIQQFAAWVTGTLIPALQQAAAWIGTNVIPVLQQFAAWFVNVGLPAIQQFAAQVQTFFRDQIAPAIQFVAETILPMLIQAWQTISSEVIPTVIALATQIQTNFENIANFITAHGEAIKNIISGVWTVISATIGNELNIISNAIALVMNLIQGDWSGAWQNVQNIVTGIWNTMQTLAGVWMDALHAIVDTGMTALQSLAQSAWDGIKAAAQSAWDGIQSLIETALNAIQSTAQSVWDGIKSAAQSAWDGIKSAANEGLEGIRGALSDAIGWAGGLATSIGTAIVSGMVSGVRGAAGQLAGAARDAVSGAVDAAKSALHIGSPSKVFADEVGTPIVQGIISGILAAHPELMTTMDRVTAQALEKARQLATAAGKDLRTYLGVGIEQAGAAADQNAVNGMMGVFNSMFNAPVKVADQKAVDGMMGVFNDMFNKPVVAADQKAVDGMMGVFNNMFNAPVKAADQKAVDGMMGVFNSMFNKPVVAADQKAVDGMMGVFNNMFNAPVKAADQKAVDGMMGVFNSMFNKPAATVASSAKALGAQATTPVKTALGDLPGAVKTALTGMATTMNASSSETTKAAMNIGDGIMAGIALGISQNVHRVIEALKGGVGIALQQTKSALGISSPSTVFANEVGRWIPAGIAAGILGGVGQISAALGASSYATMTPAGVGSSARGAGASPVTVTLQPGAVQVYGAAGQSEEAIANRVIDKLSNVFTVTGRQYGLSM